MSLRFLPPTLAMANPPPDHQSPKHSFDPSLRPSPSLPQTRPQHFPPSLHIPQHQHLPPHPSSLPHPVSVPPPPQYPSVSDPRPRPDLNSYDLFPDIPVPSHPVPQQHDTTTTTTTPPPPSAAQFPLDQKQSFDRKQTDSPFYTSLPIASASRLTKRSSRPDLHDHSSSPSLQSPSHRPVAHPGQSPGQSSLERRKAHRAYTQKSRKKVNSRFEALLDALPTPPPRLNPRSKAEILEYATETVIRLVSQNNKLELHLALSSSPQLEAWLTDHTQTARTVREVCQPIMRLFTIGLEWKGAEVWAIDSRAPMTTASLGQAWTFVPPPSGRRPSREDEARISELGAFLDSGKGDYYTTTSNEALAIVYRTGKPAWFSCEYKAQIGFDDQEMSNERTRLAQSYGISDVLFVPLILYNHVQIVVNFYNMRSRTTTPNPALQAQIDPKASIKVASEAINIIARRFCSLPGVSEFAEQ